MDSLVETSSVPEILEICLYPNLINILQAMPTHRIHTNYSAHVYNNDSRLTLKFIRAPCQNVVI